MEHEPELEVEGVKYDVHFEFTANGCVILDAIEPYADSTHRETTKAEKLLIQECLDSKFKAEIKAEKAQQPFDNFCEKADNFRESKYL